MLCLPYEVLYPLAVIDSLRIVESGISGLDPEIEDSTESISCSYPIITL